jgi:hypothetical protein
VSRRAAALDWGLATALALLVLAPLLVERGFALRGDMVFVPHQPWKGEWLGLDGSVPRAVPSDALVSLVTYVVPGDLLQKAILLVMLVAAVLGMLRLAGDVHPLARVAAGTLYVWNPFVYERLSIGHWALLCGYAALPWVAVVARRLRDAEPGAFALLVLPVAAAAWTSPTGGVLATVTVVAMVLGRPRLRSFMSGLLVCVVLNLPWLLPGLLNVGDQLAADPFGVTAFAARADTPWGALGSLLSFGGMWKASVDAPTRDSWLLSGLALALTLAGLVGLWLARRSERRTTASLAVLGIVGLVLAWLPTIAVGADLVEWTVSTVPGAGLLRDSQKWVALTALAACWGLSRTVDVVLARGVAGATALATGVVLLPIVVLPGLAWGLLGSLQPVTYPAEWDEVRAIFDDRAEARTVVVPVGIYRRFAWNDDRALLDPAPRYFPGQVLTDDALEVDDGAVAGESRTARRIAEAAGDPRAFARVLEEEDVRYLLLEKGTPGTDVTRGLAGTVLHDGAELGLIDLGHDGRARQSRYAPLIWVTDLAVLGGSMVTCAWLLWWRRRGYTSGAA